MNHVRSSTGNHPDEDGFIRALNFLHATASGKSLELTAHLIAAATWAATVEMSESHDENGGDRRPHQKKELK